MNDKPQRRIAVSRVSSLVSRMGRRLGGLILAAALPAAASSYVPMTDGALADRADAVAVVSVESVAPGPDREAIATDYLVQVERILKGEVGGSTLVVRVPGGVRADGLGLEIWGAPELAPGEQILAFLVANRDGSFGLEGLMLGVFHLRSTDQGPTLALRELAEAQAVAGDRRSGEEPLRDAERFASWIADRGRGIERRADYVLSLTPGLVAAREKGARVAANERESGPRFHPASGQDAIWYGHPLGQPGLGAEATVAALRAALEGRSADPARTIVSRYGGTTGATGGLRGGDRVNAILFDDPHGDIPGRFDCAAGGVLALGGTYFLDSVPAGRREFLEADIVVQDGTRCFFQDHPGRAAEVFAHELGRYGDGSPRGGGAAWLPKPPEEEVGEIVLRAKVARTSVQLEWKSTMAAPEAFEVGVVKADGSFLRIALAKPALRSFRIQGLSPDTSYEFRICGLVEGATVVDSNSVVVRTSK